MPDPGFVAVNFVAPTRPPRWFRYMPGNDTGAESCHGPQSEERRYLTRAGMYPSLRGITLATDSLINVWGYGGEVDPNGNVLPPEMDIETLCHRNLQHKQLLKISAFYGTPYKGLRNLVGRLYMHSVSYGISGAWGWERPLRGGRILQHVWQIRHREHIGMVRRQLQRDADTIRKPEVYSMGIPQTLILLPHMAERPASPMSSKT